MSNTKKRLDNLTGRNKSGFCTHLPILVQYGDDGSGIKREPMPPRSNDAPCFCGRPRIVLSVVYGSPEGEQ